MSAYLPKSPRRSGGNFQKILDGFLKQPGLPFSDVLDEQLIDSVFERHGSLFAMDAIFCTATTLWAFLRQVLQDGNARVVDDDAGLQSDPQHCCGC